MKSRPAKKSTARVCKCLSCSSKTKKFRWWDWLDLVGPRQLFALTFFVLMALLFMFYSRAAHAEVRRGSHSVVILNGVGSPLNGTPVVGLDAILLEDNVSYLLLEQGGKVLL